METSKNDYQRNDYYVNIMMDVRDVFIEYGRYLERNNIDEQGSIEDYENYLCNREQEESDRQDNQLNKSIPTRNDELIEFQCWISEQTEWDNEIIIIKEEEWSRFFSSNIEDDEMDMKIVQADNFYEEFEKLVGIEDFDECFIHMEYINELQNSVNLIVNVNRVEQKFIIDVA